MLWISSYQEREKIISIPFFNAVIISLKKWRRETGKRRKRFDSPSNFSPASNYVYISKRARGCIEFVFVPPISMSGLASAQCIFVPSAWQFYEPLHRDTHTQTRQFSRSASSSIGQETAERDDGYDGVSISAIIYSSQAYTYNLPPSLCSRAFLLLASLTNIPDVQ